MGIETGPVKGMKLDSTELAAGADQFTDEKGKETAFSAEGFLNRNFGKDLSRPTNAAFYEGGVLNRAKMQEGRGVVPVAESVNEAANSDSAEIIQLEQVRERLGLKLKGLEQESPTALRDLFLKRVNALKQQGIEGPGNAAYTQLSNEFGTDTTMSNEERTLKAKNLAEIFSSYQRNQRAVEGYGA